jgi:NADH-quinone oxidoreductase subunit A
MTPISIVAYLVLFGTVALGFVFVSLLLGRFLRPSAPSPQKLETYECGEPAVGSSFVQFDLRFYVVALVFIIFEVEMAFFFPWAAVFGKTVKLLRPGLSANAAAETYRDLGVPDQALALLPQTAQTGPANAALDRFAVASMIDMATFFAVLLVGFAYVWRRGDLDWVRAHRATGPVAAAESGPRRGSM